MNNQLKEFQNHLKNSKKVIALVGAGLSASSGLPTFRGSQGLWRNYNMIDLATPDSFYIDPSLVWQFYSWRRYLSLNSNPNNSHKSIIKILDQFKKDANKQFLIINQNVDGLFNKIRPNIPELFDIHGNLFTLKCTNFSCNYIEKNNFKHPLTSALKDVENENSNVTTKSPNFKPIKSIDESNLPNCPICKFLLRPGVVWFGESLPLDLITKIDNFIEDKFLMPDLILVIGTSGTVYPANSYVERVKLKGGKVAIFNTEIDDNILNGEIKNTWGFKGDAAELLPLALGDFESGFG
ncbi:uncharacterized protein KGF55_004584 [Candida pseudojiufengensis]|uniref:uncharacterized protein n=1 Tax=Candida pseudojiufengensis TaxID=497109 RepID=UPI0022253360|nr:uncharacterized protein KGF55_004584 [Candida pseudojiufengensis]KAI5960292.1 hypothetical protein KGF55_004584 [Candida pseudojiufengensis]